MTKRNLTENLNWQCDKCKTKITDSIQFECSCENRKCENCQEESCNCGQNQYNPHEESCIGKKLREEKDKAIRDKIKEHQKECSEMLERKLQELKEEVAKLNQEADESNDYIKLIETDLKTHEEILETKDLNIKELEKRPTQEQLTEKDNIIKNLNQEINEIKKNLGKPDHCCYGKWLIIPLIVAISSTLYFWSKNKNIEIND